MRGSWPVLIMVLTMACGADGDRAPDWVVTAFRRHFWHGSCSTTTPTVVEGVVYFGSGYAWERRSGVYAVDASSGQIRWRTAVGGIFTGESVLIVGDRVVLGVADTLLGLDRTSGAVQWRYPEIGYERVAAGAMVVTARFGSSVAGLRAADGVEAWRQPLPAPVDAMVSLGDGVYLSAGGRLFAVSPARGAVVELAPALASVARLASVDSTLLFTVSEPEGGRVTVELDPVSGTRDTLPLELLSVQADAIVLARGTEIVAVSRASRQPLWTSSLIPTAALGGGVFREGVMYQPDLTGDIRGFRAVHVRSGAERWRFHAGDLLNAPALDDRTLFLTSDDCRLYAFRLP